MFRTADDRFSPSIASSGKNWRRLERGERERESKEGVEDNTTRRKKRMEEGKGFNTTTIATITEQNKLLQFLSL